MCGIAGYISWSDWAKKDINLGPFLLKTMDRGRDAFGGVSLNEDNSYQIVRIIKVKDKDKFIKQYNSVNLSQMPIFMANMRAVPTSNSEGNIKTELDDLQPYIIQNGNHDRCIVHNGTIANDTQFNKTFDYTCIDYSVKRREIPIDSTTILNFDTHTFQDAVKNQTLLGSFSSVMYEKGKMLLLKNYLPLHILVDYFNKTIWWSNVEGALDTLKFNITPQFCQYDIPAYTSILLDKHKTFGENCYIIDSTIHKKGNLYKKVKDRILVVCSGGMDSGTVAAQMVEKHGPENVTLLHYHYACKAQSRETVAVKKIADYLGCDVRYISLEEVFTSFLSSRLTEKDTVVETGDTGIEFAHEWVPARNLIMLSMAIGLAEKEGYTKVMLGANLTEQAAYPDNSLDFIEKLNTLAPYSVQNGKKIAVEAPFVNMMKQEIIALGLSIKAPYHLMHSCYYGEDKACGTCGPCTMRQMAFEMNGYYDDLIPYEDRMEKRPQLKSARELYG